MSGSERGAGGKPHLTDSQLEALLQLGRKKAGDAVGFINIAAARALTDLGLAERSREGWDITASGASLLHALPPPDR